MSRHSSKKKVTPSEIKERNQVRDISDEVRDIYSKIRTGAPKGDVISKHDKQEIERAIAQASRWGSRRKKPDEKIRAMIRDCFARAPVDRLSSYQSMIGGMTNLEKMRGYRASDSGGVSEHFDTPPKVTYAVSNSYRDSSSAYSVYRERKISDEVIRARMQDYFLRHEAVSPEISQNSQNEDISSKSEDVSVIPNIPEIAKDWHKLKKHLESIVDSIQIFNQECVGIGDEEKSTASADERGVHAGKEGYSHQGGVIHTDSASSATPSNKNGEVIHTEDGVIHTKNRGYSHDSGLVHNTSMFFPTPDKVGENLLEHIVNNPLIGTLERYEQLGLHPQTGTRCKKKLMKLGLINEVKIITPKARIKLLELTEKGRIIAQKSCPNSDIQIQRTSFRHGGIEHRYWVGQAKKRLEDEGYIVEEEYPIGNGKSVDLVVVGKNGNKSEKKIAVEIETGKSDAIGNIRKCLEAGFDEVVSMATSKEVMRKIEAEVGKLAEREKEKVRVGRV